MRISAYTPDFTVDELNRFHLTAADTCLLAAIVGSEKEWAEGRKRLSNLSARDGLIPFEKSGTGKTSPNLYSVKSAIMFRCIDDLTRHNGNKKTFEYAAEVAAAVGEVAEMLVTENSDLMHIDVPESENWYVAYGSWGGKANPKIIAPGKFTPDNIMRGADAGIYGAGEMTWNILRHYPDYWYDDRLGKGLERLSRYRGADAQGRPLDPNHPWNRDLPPLERARRLVEIEEYLAEMEAKETARRDDAPSPEKDT